MPYLWQTHLSVAQGCFDPVYHQKPRDEILPFISWIPERVLDVGCGGGATGRLIKEHFPGCAVYGIELDPEAAAYASQSYDRVAVASIEADDWLPAKLPIADIDTVLLLDVLEHLYNPWQVLVSLHEILPAHCRIVASIPNAFNIQLLDELASGKWQYAPYGLLDITHIRFFTEREMRRLFEETGFTILQIGDIPHPPSMLPEITRSSEDAVETAHVVVKTGEERASKDLLTIQKVVVATKRAHAEQASRREGLTRGGRQPREASSARQQVAEESQLHPALRDTYLDLVRKCVLGMIHEDPALVAGGGVGNFSPDAREHGRDWPSTAHSMIGNKRMINVQHLAEQVVKTGVPGDFIETGVWRGGACIMIRAVLKAYDVRNRTVWVADSFQGLPPPNPELYPADLGDTHYEYAELTIPFEQVQANFVKYDLLDDQVRFLKGWFRDTLPTAPIQRLALIRVDGDMYESTMDALVNLFPKLSKGGFVIVDDYGYIDSCRRAVEDFRRANDITDPIHRIDDFGIFWQSLLPNRFSDKLPSADQLEYRPEQRGRRDSAFAAATGANIVAGKKLHRLVSELETTLAETERVLTAQVADASTSSAAADQRVRTPDRQETPEPISSGEEQRAYEAATRLIEDGDKEGALARLESLARRQSTRWEVYNDLGTLLLEHGAVDRAISALRTAISLEPSSTVSLRKLVAAYATQGEIGNVLSACHQLLRHEPDDAELPAFLRDLVSATDMRLDDFTWVSPRLQGADQKIARLREKVDGLAAANVSLDKKAKFFEFAKSRLPELTREVAAIVGVGSGSTDPAHVYAACSAVDDAEWQQVMLNSVDDPVYGGVRLPGFADETLQRNTVGSAGKQSLNEGFAFYSVIKKYLRRYARPLRRTSRVLDFGCGWGRYIRYFLKDTLATNLYGIDVDPTMVDACKQSFPYGTFSLVQPMPPTDFPEGHFDVIFAYSVFSHLSRPAADAWIAEFARILAPGAMLLVTTQGRGFIEYCRVIRREIERTGAAEHPWHLNLARAFVDTEVCLAAYDRGEHLFAPTGGGEVRPSSFYGEALIPRGYVEKCWMRYLDLVDFVDDRACLPQALIVMQKRAS